MYVHQFSPRPQSNDTTKPFIAYGKIGFAPIQPEAKTMIENDLSKVNRS